MPVAAPIPLNLAPLLAYGTWGLVTDRKIELTPGLFQAMWYFGQDSWLPFLLLDGSNVHRGNISTHLIQVEKVCGSARTTYRLKGEKLRTRTRTNRGPQRLISPSSLARRFLHILGVS